MEKKVPSYNLNLEKKNLLIYVKKCFEKKNQRIKFFKKVFLKKNHFLVSNKQVDVCVT